MAFSLCGSVSSLLFDFCFIWCLAMASGMTKSAPITKEPSSQRTTTRFKLQFDGCLRPPRDPGFPTIPYRMAVCSACVWVVHSRNNSDWVDFDRNDVDDNDETLITPLAVGARALPVSTETTSQHAEYEGLLLGLQWMVDFFSLPDWNIQYTFAENSRALENISGIDSYTSTMRQPQRVLISIEGDCKTVIDQLSGKAIPRKLESLHVRAQSLLDELTNRNVVVINDDDDDDDDGKMSDARSLESTEALAFDIECRHIPRSHNPISDSLCNNLMNIIAAKSWNDSIQKLEEAEKHVMDHELSASSPHTISERLSNILETTTKTSKYSLRPPVYDMLADLAVRTKDYKLLVDIGERLVEEGSFKTKPHSSKRRHGSSTSPMDAMKIEGNQKKKGIRYQIEGWRGLGKEKKARFLERKHKVLLSSDGGDDYNYVSNRALKGLGDIAMGDWGTAIPDTWKPVVHKWFASVRYDSEDELVALWEENIDRQ